MAVSWTLDHIGPMARTAGDVARALAVMAGGHPGDPASSPAPVPAGLATPRADVAGLRVGVPRAWFYDDCDADVLAATERVLDDLADSGAVVRDVELPMASLAGTMAWTITVAEFASLHDATIGRLDEYTPAAADRLVAGATISAAVYLKALRARTLWQRDLDALFHASDPTGAIDVLVTPATPTPAPRVAPEVDLGVFAGGDVAWLERISRNLIPFNTAGTPALVAPTGFSTAGTPLGVQVVAAPMREAQCLRVAAWWQARTDHHRVVPASVGGAGLPRAGAPR
jgi:Asp-tRNA(Asn)/Glu-tRNA(Gln) amidotransferase A subunit family amidase